MPEFLRFDPAACRFPRPFAPLLPALHWSGLSLAGAGVTPRAVFDGPGTHHFARGRYALLHAYRLAGVGPGGALMAPSYHCRTMLDPALALGAAVRFYPLHHDLTPDLDALAAQLDQATPVKAVILPHYFGIEQPAAPLAALAALCQARGIALIEDCSHAWQVAAARAATCRASPMHMVVASPYKYFACEDGGILWAGDAPVPVTHGPSLLLEMKALRNTVARRQADQAALPGIAVAAAGSLDRGAEHSESSDAPSPMYDRAREQDRSLALSRWVMRRARTDAIAAARRRHYRQWTDILAGTAGARVLFPELPAECAPYMMAVEIDRPDPWFYQLKHAGMPIWRWDDMARTACPVAQRYRLHLLHLPCHQGLSARHMDWMTSLFARVLA